MTSQKTLWELDLRTRERNLQKGNLSPKDVERYLKELPDVSANAEVVPLQQPLFGEAGAEETEPASVRAESEA